MLAGGLLALGIISVVAAHDGDGSEIADIIGAVDTAWLLIAGFLVFFMQAGFAMLTAGFVRSQETANILMKNMIDACVGGVSFWLVGWAFAYGVSDASNEFIGLGNFALNGLAEAGYGHADWFFQFAFAAAAATIVAGALAGRTKYSAYLIYTVVITGFIYPVVVHWGWDATTWMGAFTDDIWLGNGYVDFAGSGIVHTVGGIAGLMGAIAVGARLGKYGPNGEVRAIPGHNISIATIGMFILWFGWYGFNPGSTLGLSGGGASLAASVAVTTTLAAGAGGITAMLWSRFRTGRYDAGLTINGILAGLVAITAGTATVDPWASVVIGGIGALVMYYGVQMLDSVFRIDDPVGAVSVHAFAGIWGVIAVGLFSSEAGMTAAGYANPQHYGLFLGGGGEQLLMQLIGIAAIVGWTGVTAGILFFAIKFTVGLRVSEEEEMRGLDLIEHGVDAYPDFGPSGSGIFGAAELGGGGK
ncbi:MAG: ammonium transporter [Dehalococcoidia bacterium]|nr:ammonium transporter [Dehalococcoidia bacterium]MXY87283.1 ammonium transporter [Dehalococcoidia bacterium]MXZ88429.1 ammonium transporter [Dehalococcoidia bacterium]MYA53650.1 ammonium transporter [Dehalococcoidia bacterium]MYH68043.1 ammonium transporter [Dehalococcoidia bacterium]